MDSRAIGVFDSGLGGLTALSELKRLLPNEHFIYLGDTKRVPYGEKSYDELLDCAKDDFAFLLSKNVKAVLVACGTVSSNLTKEQFESVPVLCEGVILPAVKRALEISSNKKIGVIATEASIRAGAYKRELSRLCKEVEVFDTACPEFVPLIESGHTSSEDIRVLPVVQKYLLPLKEKRIDTLILGCTHYPLLSETIQKVLPSAKLVDVGKEAAKSIAKSLEKGALSSDTEGGESFFVTSKTEEFKSSAEKFLGRKIDKVNLISF